MNRQQLMAEIAALDQKINAAAAAARAPRLNTSYSKFPLASFISAAFFIAVGLFGPPYAPPAVPGIAFTAAIGLGVLIALFAVYRTLRWLMSKRKPSSVNEYRNQTDEVRELQERRKQLQAQLDSMR